MTAATAVTAPAPAAVAATAAAVTAVAATANPGLQTPLGEVQRPQFAATAAVSPTQGCRHRSAKSSAHSWSETR